MYSYKDDSEIFYRNNNVKLRNIFLKFILTDSNNLKKVDVNLLINQLIAGKFGEAPYTEFYDNYLFLKSSSSIEEKINELIVQLKDSKSIDVACELVNIPKNKVLIWFELGKNYEEPFYKLYKEYKNISNDLIIEKINIFLDSFDGFDEAHACEVSNISELQLAVWLRLNNLGSIFKKLYSNYLEILKSNKYNNHLDFYNPKISKNTLDMLFILSNIGRTKYKKFYDYYNHIENKLSVSYPESYIEQFLDLFHNKHNITSLKFLDTSSVETCDLLDLVNSKTQNKVFYKENNIDIFLNYVSLGYDDYEASKKAKISYHLINNWLTEGIPELSYDTFFEDYNSALILGNYFEFINDKADEFLCLLNEGKSIKTACKILFLSFRDIELYLNLGYLNFKPYDVFYQEYSNLLKSSFYKEMNLVTFLNEVKLGKFKRGAARKSKIKIKTINDYIDEGRAGNEPYIYFLYDYEQALVNNFFTDDSLKKLKLFNSLILEGSTDLEASKECNIPIEVIEYWKSLRIWKNRFNKSTSINNENKSSDSKSIKPKSNFLFGYDVKEIINKFLEGIKEGLSDYDVSEKYNLPYGKIKYWLELGSKQTGKYAGFYQEYCEIKCINFYKINNINQFLKEIEIGTMKNEALKIINMSESNFNYYMNRRKYDKRFSKFYEDYNEALLKFFNSEKESKRIKFIEEFTKGLSFEESIKNSEISKSYVEKCFNLKDETDYFKKFYKDYKKAENDGYFFRISGKTNEFFELISEGVPIQEACNISGISKNKVNVWILNKKNDKKIEVFSKKFFESMISYFNSNDTSNKKNEFLNLIENGENIKDACEISGLNIKVVEKWISYGEKNRSPFVNFLEKYNNAQINFYNSKLCVEKRKHVIKFIENGETPNKSFIKSGLNPYLVRKWISLGEKGENLYVHFYEEYNKSLHNQLINFEEKIEEFLNLISEGNSNKSACEIVGINDYLLNYWIQNGSKGNKLYSDFYERYSEIKF